MGSMGELMKPMRLLLASQSPRRLHLLQSAGFEVEVQPQNIDESVYVGEKVEDVVLRLAVAKAKAVGTSPLPVIGSDTLVAVDQYILGQPQGESHAMDMLRMLSGRKHQVLTGICVCYQNQTLSRCVVTSVCFRSVSDREIETYLQHNKYMDKAGAYAIQSGASRFITAIQGPIDNVIGLPVCDVSELLRQIMKT